LSTLADVFECRTSVDARKQRQLKPLLDELCAALKEKVQRPHPYDLSLDHKKQLRSVGAYKEGARGLEAHLGGKQVALYRLMSVGVLQYYVTKWIGPHLSDGALMEVLLERSNGAWLSLSDVAQKEFCNARRFSWWTTFDGLLQQPFIGGRRLGLVDDWIASDSVLLRLDVSDLSVVRVCVPTIIDGFDGPIFDAVDSEAHSEAGRTIDLNPPGPLRPGETELAISPIPVHAISMLPLKIEGNLRSGDPVPQTRVTWTRLVQYYRSL
jgi:hypothetical protein